MNLKDTSLDTNNETGLLADDSFDLVQEVANADVECLNQNILIKTMEEIKESFESKFDVVTETAKTNNAKLHAKINTVNQNIRDLQSTIDETKSLLVEQNKVQRLEFAIAHIDLSESFNYYYGDESVSVSSRELIQTILYWFALGRGFNLPANARLIRENSISEFLDNSPQKSFLGKLSVQLDKLIGHKPRFEDRGNGKWTVWYE